MAQEPHRKKSTKRTELAAWIEHARPRSIGEIDFEELRRVLAPISESYLRKLLRESGVPLAPMVEGVRQGDMDELARTLLALLDEYEAADSVRQTAVRRLVIAAKDHARWSKRALKDEIVLWMLTWLENPPVFRAWIKLRRKAHERPGS